jgi:hypothetical protein
MYFRRLVLSSQGGLRHGIPTAYQDMTDCLSGHCSCMLVAYTYWLWQSIITVDWVLQFWTTYAGKISSFIEIFFGLGHNLNAKGSIFISNCYFPLYYSRKQKYFCPLSVSNRVPSLYKRDALPFELSGLRLNKIRS